jgi:hypothetical protein
MAWLIFSPPAISQDINPPKNYTRIKNLIDTWLVYDNKYQGHIPYISGRHQHPKAMSFWLDLPQYTRYELLLYSFPNTYLLVNNTLCRKITHKGWLILRLDSLQKIHGKQPLFCTIYDNEQRLPLAAIFVGVRHQYHLNNTQNTSQAVTLDRRNRADDYKDTVILLMLFVVGVYAGLWNYNHKLLSNFFSRYSSLSIASKKDMLLINKPLGTINLLFLGGHSLVVALFYLLMSLLTPRQSPSYFTSDFLLPDGVLYSYAYLTLTIFGIFILKYLFVTFFGNLLNVLQNSQQTHFFEYIRLSGIFYTGSCLITMFFFISYPKFYTVFYEFYSYLIFLFHVLQAIVMCIYVYKQTEMRNLYLFYYLCITEATPLLIGIKLLF